MADRPPPPGPHAGRAAAAASLSFYAVSEFSGFGVAIRHGGAVYVGLPLWRLIVGDEGESLLRTLRAVRCCESAGPVNLCGSLTLYPPGPLVPHTTDRVEFHEAR